MVTLKKYDNINVIARAKYKIFQYKKYNIEIENKRIIKWKSTNYIDQLSI